ncbi:MAG: chitobiase/beta-hexosaminidase C-terminal domain-containing protein [Proteobacteria bacterium]|nr:chitobiase/beta-hexosaminidase C-terminal domain-containing protein [Pseudomonadota bacterium]
MKGKPFLVLGIIFALAGVVSRLNLPEKTLPPVTIQPAPGNYNRPVDLTFKTESNATVYFSLGPGEPIPYISPVRLRHSAVVRFFAVDSFGNRSPSGEAVYKVVPDVEKPVTIVSPQGGSFTHPVAVRLITDPDAHVFFTLDGTPPTQESTIYTEPIPLFRTTSLRFFARDEAGNREETRRETYRMTIDETKPATLAVPSGGLFNNAIKVSLSAGEGNTIHYTVDGTPPTEKSPVYSGPVEMVRSGVIRFFAVDGEGNREDPREENYLIDLDPPLVSADPPGGTFSGPVTVILQSSEPGQIFCEPCPNAARPGSRLYRGPLRLSESTTLSFYAVDLAGNIGTVESREYVIDRAPPEVILRPPEGEYPGKIRVMIETSEPADVYYTLDGSIPDEKSLRYESPVDIEKNTVLSWLAVDKVGNKGVPGQAKYILDRTPPVAEAQPKGGKFLGPISVTLASEEGSVIRYTLDGTDPTEKSPVYKGPFLLERYTVLKFFSTDESGNSGDIITETYQIPTGVAPQGN